VLRDVPNIWVDLSGSGLDGGMLEGALDAVGPARLLWGADVTLDAGIAKLRYLESLGLPPEAIAGIRHRNAEAIFPEGCFR
jgi:predicted TIM-barrel fold metal-dependent hydrolase